MILVAILFGFFLGYIAGKDPQDYVKAFNWVKSKFTK